MDQDAILLAIDGHIARITLNRPEQHNSLATEDIALFRQRLDAVTAHPDVRVLVLTGSGAHTFCAGASLKQFRSGDMSGELFTTLTEQLAALRIPSVCALNGSVFGGGAEIALCCDYRIGIRGSRMLVPAARIGICYPLSGLKRYVDKLGLSAAKRVLVASEELSDEDMLRIGFLHRVVDAAELEACTRDFAEHIAGLAPMAVQAMKRLLGDISRGAVDEDEARRLSEACTGSADFREGLAAQRERRKPDFSGR